jgi:REP element-mobilizing transposase RayT
MVARPIGSSPHVGKPRGGGVAEGSRVWLRSRLHADEPRGGLFSNDRIAASASVGAYGSFVCRQAVPRYDGACPHRTLIATRMRWQRAINASTSHINRWLTVHQRIKFGSVIYPLCEAPIIRSEIYTPDNCTFSAPLCWSVTLFWNEAESSDDWMVDLTNALEKDNIRLLQHRFANSKTSQFLVSTQVSSAPSLIVQRLKGRIYHAVRNRKPKPLRGNFALRSIGKAGREETEKYVTDQLGHHVMADQRVQAALEELQYHDTTVTLSDPVRSSHGLYWYNLHCVFVHRERWRCVDLAQLHRVQHGILSLSRHERIQLAAVGVLTDHVHLLARCPYDRSPLEIALSYLLGLSSFWDGRAIYQHGGYLGTVGEYTTNAIK